MGSTQESQPTKTLLLHSAKDLRLSTQSLPPPPPSQVRVAIKSTGLCGSDLHYYAAGRNGDFIVRAPLCLGHESSGVVVATGPDVTNLSIGTRVALEVGMPCRTCALCMAGRYNICPNLLFRSSAKVFPHVDGTLTEYVNHPADLCHVLPDNVTFAQGALVEPLAVCLHAIRRSDSNDSIGGSALVLGAGAIGILMAGALSVQGVTDVVVADIDERRLEIAKRLPGLGIKTTLLPKKAPPETPPKIEETLKDAKAVAEMICSQHGLAGFERVFEATGVEFCVQTGIYASLPGGKLVLVGMGKPVQTLPLSAAALREVDIVGVFRYANSYTSAIKLMASGKLKGVSEALVTHRRKLEEGEQAFELAMKGVDGDGKPVLKVVIEA